MFKTYKRLLKSIGKYKTASLLAPATIAFEVVMEVIIPLLMAKLIDNGVNKGDMSYILRIGAILAGCCIISLCGGVLSGRFAAVASAGFGRISAMICIKISRPFLSQTSTNSAPHQS